jgi:hypothetical protein
LPEPVIVPSPLHTGHILPVGKLIGPVPLYLCPDSLEIGSKTQLGQTVSLVISEYFKVHGTTRPLSETKLSIEIA